VNDIRRNAAALLALFMLGLAALLVILLPTACSGKQLEQYNDAPVGVQNTGPADVINMPDGFSNVATKCDHGNRVYVIFHNDKPYGSVAVVAKDPTCPQ
jgi:hypothetical protein